MNDIKKNIIGLKLQDAKKWCSDNNVKLRVACTDGKHHILTQDFDPNRFNVEIVNGFIINFKKY